MEKYSSIYGESKIRRLCGGVLLLDLSPDAAIKFVEELYSKFSKDKVKTWLLTEPNFEIEPLVLEKTYNISGKFSNIWVLIDFIMNKYRGVLVSETMSGNARTYQVKTKYGSVNVRFERIPIANTGEQILLRVRVSGYGSSVPYFFDKLQEELSPLVR